MKKLAKILICLFALMLCFSVMACEDPNNEDQGGPQTPPPAITPGDFGDITYLDKTPAQTYEAILQKINGISNLSVTNNTKMIITVKTSAGFDVDYSNCKTYSSYIIENEKFSGSFSTEGLSFYYGNNIEEKIITTCVEGNVYLYNSLNTQQKIKDQGSFAQVKQQLSSQIILPEKPLPTILDETLKNGYFNSVSEGTTLTLRLSTAESEAFIKAYTKTVTAQNVSYGEATLIVMLDSEANLKYLSYTCSKKAEIGDGTIIDYEEIKGTIKISETIAGTVKAPLDAEEYIQTDFIN